MKKCPETVEELNETITRETVDHAVSLIKTARVMLQAQTPEYLIAILNLDAALKWIKSRVRKKRV